MSTITREQLKIFHENRETGLVVRFSGWVYQLEPHDGEVYRLVVEDLQDGEWYVHLYVETPTGKEKCFSFTFKGTGAELYDFIVSALVNRTARSHPLYERASVDEDADVESVVVDFAIAVDEAHFLERFFDHLETKVEYENPWRQWIEDFAKSVFTSEEAIETFVQEEWIEYVSAILNYDSKVWALYEETKADYYFTNAADDIIHHLPNMHSITDVMRRVLYKAFEENVWVFEDALIEAHREKEDWI